VVLGFFEMVFQTFLEIAVCRFVVPSQSGFQRIDVFQTMQRKVVHRIDVFAEEIHKIAPWIVTSRDEGAHATAIPACAKRIAIASAANLQRERQTICGSSCRPERFFIPFHGDRGWRFHIYRLGVPCAPPQL